MKKRLRAEIYDSFVKMGQQGLKVDPAVYSVVVARLADTQLCGPHARSAPPANSPSGALRKLSGSAISSSLTPR